jgi:AcrR family transcriptional regulator
MVVKKGPKPRFTRESVVDAALALANRRGLAALNFRALASELGVTPMTLYGYVENRDDLLERMLSQAFSQPPPLQPDEHDWRAGVREVVTAAHDIMVSNPAVVEMLMTGVPATAVDNYRECLFAILLDAGFDESAAVDAVSSLLGYALGLAIVEAFRPRTNPDGSLARYRTLSETEFPNLRRVASDYARRDARAPFATGVQHLVAGLGSPVARSSS